MSTRAAVLVVDDEPGIREMLSYELSQEGFEVETVASGLAAVQAVKRRKFDLAVTDLKMPGMDGVATVEALRALDPDLEVIVATWTPVAAGPCASTWPWRSAANCSTGTAPRSPSTGRRAQDRSSGFASPGRRREEWDESLHSRRG